MQLCHNYGNIKQHWIKGLFRNGQNTACCWCLFSNLEALVLWNSQENLSVFLICHAGYLEDLHLSFCLCSGTTWAPSPGSWVGLRVIVIAWGLSKGGRKLARRSMRREKGQQETVFRSGLKPGLQGMHEASLQPSPVFSLICWSCFPTAFSLSSCLPFGSYFRSLPSPSTMWPRSHKSKNSSRTFPCPQIRLIQTSGLQNFVLFTWLLFFFWPFLFPS